VPEINWTALAVFILLFGFITWLGFAAARWRKGDLDLLHEWGLGGRRFGTLVTWFFGGRRHLHRLYVHRRSRAGVRHRCDRLLCGSVHHHHLSLLFLIFPRLWNVCHKHGYITAADFVRGRFGNRWLALAVTVTGIVATLPYIALQLVGIQVVVGALGVTGSGIAADLPLIIAFGVLAAFTYSSGLRAPASIAIVQDVADLRRDLRHHHRRAAENSAGFGKIFAARCTTSKLAAGRFRRDHTTSRLFRLRPRLALALAPRSPWFLYPHSMTAILSANPDMPFAATRRILPGYSFMLRLLAMIGLFVIAAGITRTCRLCPRIQAIRQQLRRAALHLADVPLLVRRRGIRRHSHRSPGAGGHHVDCGGQSYTRNNPREFVNRNPTNKQEAPDGEMGVAHRQTGRPHIHLVRTDEVRHSIAVARRDLDHSDAAGRHARCLYTLVQRLALARGLGRRKRLRAPRWRVASKLTPTFRADRGRGIPSRAIPPSTRWP